MSAKFNAQMLTGAMWVEITRAPAAVSRPTSVSISGSPAATRLPKASTSTIMVTGQDSTSDLIIAEWLTLLKSDHSALSPVRFTDTVDVASFDTGPVRSSAARTIALASAPAPPCTTAVRPSFDSDTPGWGETTVLTRLSARSSASARATMRCAAGSFAIGPLPSCTTTCRAVAPSPWKFFAITSRAATDWLPLSSHPAPESADSTLGAKAPNPARTSSQTTRTVRRCVAAHTPSRARPAGSLLGRRLRTVAGRRRSVVDGTADGRGHRTLHRLRGTVCAGSCVRHLVAYRRRARPGLRPG